jgi:hypothetical protein
VALLPLSLSLAQEMPIVDDPRLLEELDRHQDSRYPVGEPFPEEVLTCRYYQNAMVDHIVKDANGDPKILLTSVVTNAASPSGRFPNIVRMAGRGYWVRTPVPITWDGWTHVHVSRDLQQVFLLMGSGRPEERSVVSNDGGNSWRYGESIRKYVYSHLIHYFSMSETGSGTAIEHNDGDRGRDGAACGSR